MSLSHSLSRYLSMSLSLYSGVSAFVCLFSSRLFVVKEGFKEYNFSIQRIQFFHVFFFLICFYALQGLEIALNFVFKIHRMLILPNTFPAGYPAVSKVGTEYPYSRRILNIIGWQQYIRYPEVHGWIQDI